MQIYSCIKFFFACVHVIDKKIAKDFLTAFSFAQETNFFSKFLMASTGEANILLD